jgi:acetyl-CoA carboxylase biotin carboxyl carrier protein
VDSKEIRELIEYVSRSNFATFEMERDGFRIKLVKGQPAPLSLPAVTPVDRAPEALPPAVDVAVDAAAVPSGLHELHSPIVGTFYSAPAPDAPDFVEVGARVQKGQVICIVEAMKVMNEIESEVDGEIVEVLVKNGQPVEFGEVLFRLRLA